MSTYSASNLPSNTVSVKEYESMLKWCSTIHAKLSDLERIVRHCEVKSVVQKYQSSLNTSSSQLWAKIGIKSLRETSNDIARLMNCIQASLSGKDSDSDYYKYSVDELKYFTYEWENLLKGEIGNYLKKERQFTDYKDDELMIQSLKKLDYSLREDEQLMRLIQLNILDTHKTVFTINELAGKTLKTIEASRFRVKSAKFFHNFTFGFQFFFIFFLLAIVTAILIMVLVKII